MTTDYRLITFVLLGILFATAEFAAFRPSMASENEKSGQSTSKTTDSSSKAPVNWDDCYRSLVQQFDRLKAISRQQPDNRVLLDRELAAMKECLVALQGAGPKEKAGTSKIGSAAKDRQPSDSKSTTSTDSDKPAGPVDPSSKKPTKEDIERYEAAVNRTYLPGKALEEVKKKGAVSPEDLAKLNSAAASEIEKLDKMLDQKPMAKDELQQGLQRLDKIIQRMGSPPPPSRRTKS